MAKEAHEKRIDELERSGVSPLIIDIVKANPDAQYDPVGKYEPRPDSAALSDPDARKEAKAREDAARAADRAPKATSPTA